MALYGRDGEMRVSRAQVLAAGAEAIYGPRWMRAMARLADVDESAVRHWMRGRTEIPSYALERLRDELRSRRGVLEAALKSIETSLGADVCTTPRL